MPPSSLASTPFLRTTVAEETIVALSQGYSVLCGEFLFKIRDKNEADDPRLAACIGRWRRYLHEQSAAVKLVSRTPSVEEELMAGLPGRGELFVFHGRLGR